jgi:hypothetical protein
MGAWPTSGKISTIQPGFSVAAERAADTPGRAGAAGSEEDPVQVRAAKPLDQHQRRMRGGRVTDES